MRFTNYYWLLLLLGLIPFYFFEINNFYTIKKLFNAQDTKKIITRKLIKLLCYTLALILLVFSIAGINLGKIETNKKQTDIELIFVLDISNSMNIKDTLHSRLDISKAIITLINTETPNINKSLVLCKGKSILSIPKTVDYQAINAALEKTTSMSLTSAGSNLEYAIKLISKQNKNNTTKKIIVFFTDGEETSGDILNQIDILDENGISCIMIGVGTTLGGTIKIYNDKNQEELIVSKLNEEKLKTFITKLSDINSAYLKYDNIDIVEKIVSLISKIQSEKQFSIKEVYYGTTISNFLALIFFIAGFIGGGYEW